MPHEEEYFICDKCKRIWQEPDMPVMATKEWHSTAKESGENIKEVKVFICPDCFMKEKRDFFIK